MKKVIILGAKGRFGRASTAAFVNAGWDVSVFGRNWQDGGPLGMRRFSGNAKDPVGLARACDGQDVIVNAINPPYENWARDLPQITASVVAAAQQSNATVLIPGNVYNYGENGPKVWTEDTQWKPTTRKGRLRVGMENAYRKAGVKTIVLRGGDYIDTVKSGNWFDVQITPQSHKGRTSYPGPLDQEHAWAYLPDIARAAVMLAERREELEAFAEFGFEGYTLTGASLVERIGKVTGKTQKISGVPWGLVRLLGLFKAPMREIYEMRYLWNIPHRLDGNKLARFLPDFLPTPIDVALRAALAS